MQRTDLLLCICFLNVLLLPFQGDRFNNHLFPLKYLVDHELAGPDSYYYVISDAQAAKE